MTGRTGIGITEIQAGTYVVMDNYHGQMASFLTGAVIPLDGGQVIDRE